MKQAIVNAAFRARRAIGKARSRQIEKRIDEILSDPAPPSTGRAESDFDALQRAYQGIPEYGYDARSMWTRGATRSIQLMDLLEWKENAHTLEIGCGDGLVSYHLASYGHQVSLTDMDDWRTSRAKALDFHGGEFENGLPFESEQFDLIFTYNTFEHVNDPAKCLQEMLRLTQPGGLLYIDFNPTYSSPWGLHAYRAMRMPYPQFLFSDAFVTDYIRTNGISDLGGQYKTALQPLNRWRIGQFDKLWEGSGCAIERREYDFGAEHVGLIRRYPECFRGRGLNYRDVTIDGTRVLLRKPA